jgi:uncharacterized protein (TIGR02246 family)
MQPFCRVLFVFASVISCMMHHEVMSTVFAQEALAQVGAETHSEADLGAIESAIGSYVEAFNALDAKKLATLWAPQGIYVSRSSGERITGRDAIAEEFEAIFSSENVPHLAVETETIEFISPNVALERGIATVTHAKGENGDGSASRSTYRVVYVKQASKWLIDRVTEEEVEIQISNYDKLKELEWIIGNWVDVGGKTTIETECNWTKNKNYISRKYSVSQEGQVKFSGLQIIGWDPKANEIRSWLFDSGGGFVAGTWSRREDEWIVQSVATFPDGASGSNTSIFRPLEEGRYAWKKINRVVDGEILPNIDEVIVKRK